jgi:hypothetical protein
MDKQRAEEILGKADFDFFSDNDGTVYLEGGYTAEQLEAIVWVMRNSK